MKKCFAWLLTLVMLVCAAAAPARADGGSMEAMATTPLGNSSNAKIANIRLAADAISGYFVPYGSTFSFNDATGPRTSEAGYRMADNGRGANVRGGGVSQVATTLFLALEQLDGITYPALRTYGSRFKDTYVDDGDDAVLTDYKNGIDFQFTNNVGDIMISLYVDGTDVCCRLSVDQDASEVGASIAYAATPVNGTNAYENNIALAAQNIDGVTLANGETFSFNSTVGPRTGEFGYQRAINGRGVKVVGGGVAQVASTIYLAVKALDCVTVDEIKTYGARYNQTYVTDAADAVVTDYGNNQDFSFHYTGTGELTIRVYTATSGNTLICEIFESGNSWN